MAEFSIPYTTPGNYTYDSNKIEVVGGLAKLKYLLPLDFTFHAKYDVDINGTWGNGNLTGTAHSGASVSGGKLDLSPTPWDKYVDYNAALNADSTQVGAVRFNITPNFSGIGLKHGMFEIRNIGLSNNNKIWLRQWHNGAMSVVVFDENDVVLISQYLGVWSPTAGQEYEMELNWDFTTGETRLFIDGVQCGITMTATGIRNSSSELLRVGGSGGAFPPDCKIDNFTVFNQVQHTTDYTPTPFPITIYPTDEPDIYKTTGEEDEYLDIFTDFSEFLGVGNQGSIGYNLSEDGLSWKYWDGSVWLGAGVGDYNTAADINTHIGSFPAATQKIFTKAFLISNGSQQIELDENKVGYTRSAIPTYVTYAEFRILTRVASQKTMSDAQLKPFITHAEWIVDSYCFVERAYDNQKRKFPAIDYGTGIPDDVKKSTAEITSDLILKGTPTSSGKDVKSEAWTGSGGYSKQHGEGSNTGVVVIPPLAIRLLRKYHKTRFTY